MFVLYIYLDAEIHYSILLQKWALSWNKKHKKKVWIVPTWGTGKLFVNLPHIQQILWYCSSKQHIPFEVICSAYIIGGDHECGCNHLTSIFYV